MRPQDLDPMAHVNNAAYVDFLDESLLAAGHQSWLRRLPRRYRLEYPAPAGLGASITASVWPTADGMAYRLTGPDGADVVRLTLDADTRDEAFREAVAARRPRHAPGKDTLAG